LSNSATATQQEQAADYLTILPQILLLLVELEIHHSNLAPQLQELKAPWFGEDVRELLAGLDELEDDLSSINFITKKVILDVDVLALVGEDRVLGEGDGGLTVHHQHQWQASFSTSSPSSRRSHTPWHTAVAVAMYSGSHVNSATTFYSCDCQATAVKPRMTSTPEVLFRGSAHQLCPPYLRC
jgi:hypothetical protein